MGTTTTLELAPEDDEPEVGVGSNPWSGWPVSDDDVEFVLGSMSGLGLGSPTSTLTSTSSPTLG
ncbi:hypothetical protein TIFTF001_006765 [Ficus carica]|uniref:Uncharacterized protein n=1 Tax=Ficus carica TaxID=3494 RepID=A0AA88DG01_FICCA|nr:hypothetical protein TIFTF001_006765 [Ficus carica]